MNLADQRSSLLFLGNSLWALFSLQVSLSTTLVFICPTRKMQLFHDCADFFLMISIKAFPIYMQSRFSSQTSSKLSVWPLISEDLDGSHIWEHFLQKWLARGVENVMFMYIPSNILQMFFMHMCLGSLKSGVIAVLPSRCCRTPAPINFCQCGQYVRKQGSESLASWGWLHVPHYWPSGSWRRSL